jgi:hypothetical protein
MKLPFFQHIGIGLTVMGRTVRWAELSRIRHRVRIRRVATEPFRDGEEGPEGAVHRLVERLSPRERRVATHLPAQQTRKIVIEVPGFEDPAAREAWIQRRAAELLPAGVDAHLFTIRFVPFADKHRFRAPQQQEENRAPRRHDRIGPSDPSDAGPGAAKTSSAERGLLVMARQDAIAARVDMLRAAGLEPVFIGSPVPLLGLAIGLDPSLRERAKNAGWILWRDGHDVALVHYAGGRFAGLVPIRRSGSPEAVLRAAEEYEAPVPGEAVPHTPRPLCVMGSEARAWCRAARQGGSPYLDSWGLHPFQIASREAGDASGHGTGSALALGLGLLYAQEAPANLLPPSVLDAARRAGERRDGLRALTGIGLLCLALILGAVGLEAYLQTRAAAAGRQVSAAAHRLTRVDSARARLRAFQRHAARIDEVTSMRTAAAPLLEHLARTVPAGLWMEAVTFRRTAPDSGALEDSALPGQVSHGDVPSLRTSDSLRGPHPTVVVLRGWAVDAGAPAQLVAALEESPSLTGVQPILIEQVGLADARRRITHWPGATAFDDRPIFFEVRLTAPLSTPEGDMSASELAVLQDMMKGRAPW